MASTVFPTELLREIVVALVQSAPPRSTRYWECSKPHWKESGAEAVSLTSRAMRALLLEAWFDALFVKSHSELQDFGEIWPHLDLPSRVWEAHCGVHPPRHKIRGNANEIWDLSPFPRLVRVRFDMSPGDSKIRLNNIPPLLRELEIRGCSRPDPNLCRNIAEMFPQLEVLKLEQTMTWCSLCNLVGLSMFKTEPPLRLVYERGIGLPMHYARFLAPLQHLQAVHLTVACRISGSYTLNAAKNDILWSGECDDCIKRTLQRDKVFAKTWADRKAQYERPPALKCVVWSFKPNEWKGWR